MAEDARRFVRFRKDMPVVVGLTQPEAMANLENLKAFGDEVVAVARKHARLPLILDLESVGYLSSAALSELIRIREAVTSNGGTFRLCGVTEPMYKVFDVTKLAGEFELRADESSGEAVERFKRDLAASASAS
jgi:anti-anti-sigma factor